MSSLILAVALVTAGTKAQTPAVSSIKSYAGSCMDRIEIEYNPAVTSNQNQVYPNGATGGSLQAECPLDIADEYVSSVTQYIKPNSNDCDQFFGAAFRFTIESLANGTTRICDFLSDQGPISGLDVYSLVDPQNQPDVVGPVTVDLPYQLSSLGVNTNANPDRVFAAGGPYRIVPMPTSQPTAAVPISGVWGYSKPTGSDAYPCIDQLLYTKGDDVFAGLIQFGNTFNCLDLGQPAGCPGQAQFWDIPGRQQFCPATPPNQRYPLSKSSCPINNFNKPNVANDGTKPPPLGQAGPGRFFSLSGLFGTGSDRTTEYLSAIVQYDGGSCNMVSDLGAGISFKLRDRVTGAETRTINIWGKTMNSAAVTSVIREFEVTCESGLMIVDFFTSQGYISQIETDFVRDANGNAVTPTCDNFPTLVPIPSPSKGPTLDPSPVPVPQPTSIPAPAPTFAPSPSPTTTCTGVCTETKDAVDALKAQMDAQDVQIRKIKKKVNSVEKLVKQIKDAVVPAPTTSPVATP